MKKLNFQFDSLCDRIIREARHMKDGDGRLTIMINGKRQYITFKKKERIISLCKRLRFMLNNRFRC